MIKGYLTGTSGWVIALVLAFWATAAPAEPLMLEPTDGSHPLNSHLSYRFSTDESGVVDMAEQAEAFVPHTVPAILNLGYRSDPLWVTFRVDNTGPPSHWILEYGYYPPRVFELYRKEGPESFRRIDRTENEWPSRYLAYDLALEPGLNEFFLKIQSNASLTVPLTLSSHKEFARNKQFFYFAQALYFGWVASLILYNLFLFTSLRDARFGYYVLFASSLALALAFYYGFPQQLFGLGYTDNTTRVGTVLFNLASLFAISFARRFLNTPSHAPIGDRVLLAISLTFWASIVIVLIWPTATASSWLLSLGAPVGAIVAMVIAFLCLARGYKQARFFLIAWSALLLGSIATSTRNFGLLDTSPLTSYGIQIGSAVEMLLLAVALADSMRIERNQYERTQKASLADSLRLQKILTRNQSRLERKVQKRTQNIQASLYKVQSAFKTYMRLGAMISHEFKNPLNAILNQIETLNMERQHGIDQTEKRLTSIEGQAKRLRTLFEHWLSTDQLISGQLSTDFKSVSLLPWLEETRELIESIHADRHFEFSLSVEPGTRVTMDTTLVQIGFFNLIDNACRYSPPDSSIRVIARVSDTTLTLGVVNDSGAVMTQEKLNESLETYSTVSEHRNNGTGLGLSLVRLISDTHQGSLSAQLLDSGKVQFVMQLPVAS